MTDRWYTPEECQEMYDTMGETNLLGTSVENEIERVEREAWMKANGFVHPNLGINWPAGDAWGAGEYMVRFERRWQEVKRKDDVERLKQE